MLIEKNMHYTTIFQNMYVWWYSAVVTVGLSVLRRRHPGKILCNVMLGWSPAIGGCFDAFPEAGRIGASRLFFLCNIGVMTSIIAMLTFEFSDMNDWTVEVLKWYFNVSQVVAGASGNLIPFGIKNMVASFRKPGSLVVMTSNIANVKIDSSAMELLQCVHFLLCQEGMKNRTLRKVVMKLHSDRLSRQANFFLRADDTGNNSLTRNFQMTTQPAILVSKLETIIKELTARLKHINEMCEETRIKIGLENRHLLVSISIEVVLTMVDITAAEPKGNTQSEMVRLHVAAMCAHTKSLTTSKETAVFASVGELFLRNPLLQVLSTFSWPLAFFTATLYFYDFAKGKYWMGCFSMLLLPTFITVLSCLDRNVVKTLLRNFQTWFSLLHTMLLLGSLLLILILKYF